MSAVTLAERRSALRPPTPLQPRSPSPGGGGPASSGAGPAPALVVAVQAPGPGHLGLPIHPDLPDDALPLLQPLRALQLLRRREDVLVQSPLEAAVSADRDVRAAIVAVAAVAAVAAALLVRQELLPGTRPPPTVHAAGQPHHQRSQGEDQPEAHARHEVQRCSLGVFWRRREKRALERWQLQPALYTAHQTPKR